MSAVGALRSSHLLFATGLGYALPEAGPVHRFDVENRLYGLLSTQSELGDHPTIPLGIVLPKVVQQPLTLTHHHQQASAAVMVVFVLAQMLGQVTDSLGEQRHLDLGGSGIAVMSTELSDYFLGRSHLSHSISTSQTGMYSSGNRPECSTLPAIWCAPAREHVAASPPVPLAELRLCRPGRRPLVDPEHEPVESDHRPTLELQDRQQDAQVGEFEHGQVGP